MSETMATEPALLETSPARPQPRVPARVAALEATALRAAFWTFMDYGFGQSLRVVNSLVLTRLLLPAAFGEMALVTTLIVGMTLLSDIGLAPSVIQSKRGDEPQFLNTAWTLQAGRGMAIWCFAVAFAFPAARFYHDPTLKVLLPILALTSIITGFNSTGLLTLSRHMGVRRLFLIDISTQVVALVVTIVWAVLYPSVWALVAGNITCNIYRLAISHSQRVVPGPRNRFCLDRESLRDIVHFGKWIILGTAFYFFASQADRLVLGRLVSMTVLGVYGIAYQISDVPRSVINALSQKVLFPFIAKLVHLPMGDFRGQFLRYRRYTLAVGGLLLSTMAVWGNLIILKLYPARYSEASWMIPVLALGLWHTLLYTTTGPVLFALGKSTYNAVGNAAYAAAMLIGIPLAYHFYGLPGAVVGIAAGDLPLYLVTQFGATREGIKPLWQDLQLTVGLMCCLVLEFTLRKAF